MNIRDFEGGFFVEGLTGKREPCRAETMYQAACAADGDIIGKTDFYLSMYQFPAAFVERIKAHGTAGYKGVCWSRFLWFDIDREGDLPAALADAKRLADFLVSGRTSDADSPGMEPVNMLDDDLTGCFVPDSESVSLWFSGAKGFHVGLPISVFGEAAAASEAFHTQCKAVAAEIARQAGVTIDTAVYDRVRLFRCPNTRHKKTGLYKIPLSFWELTGMEELDAILKRAESPRRQVESETRALDDVPFCSRVPEMEAAAALWRKVCEPLIPMDGSGGEHEKDTDKQTREMLPTWCQTQTLPVSGEVVARLRRSTLDLIWYGAPHGSRAVNLFNAAADCTRCGWPRDGVFSVLMDVGRRMKLSGRETEKQINAGIIAGSERGAA